MLSKSGLVGAQVEVGVKCVPIEVSLATSGGKIAEAETVGVGIPVKIKTSVGSEANNKSFKGCPLECDQRRS